MAVRERKGRSIVKSVSWRVSATATTITLAYLFTGSLTTSLSIGGLEVVAKLVLYYLHERAWSNISGGLTPVPEDD